MSASLSSMRLEAETPLTELSGESIKGELTVEPSLGVDDEVYMLGAYK